MAKTLRQHEDEKKQRQAAQQAGGPDEGPEDPEEEGGEEGAGSEAGPASGSGAGSGRKGKVATIPTAGYPPEVVGAIFAELDKHHAELDRLSGAIKNDIKASYQRAADVHNVPTAVLRHLYHAHRAEAKRVKKETKKFDETQQAQLKLLKKALGEYQQTPLGQAALQAAGNA